MLYLRDWDDLPEYMKTPEVRPYWEKLKNRQTQLVIKRLFDITAGSVLLVLSGPLLLAVSITIARESGRPVIYRQERVTAYGHRFRIHKFRTMVKEAEYIGNSLTDNNDSRITGAGRTLRRYKLDELPQLIDVIRGNMSFVGTRPEVPKYVEKYEPVYYATLLMPAGITSEASIQYMDEQRMLEGAADTDRVYLEEILPQKMRINLDSLQKFSITSDLKTIMHTITALCGKAAHRT